MKPKLVVITPPKQLVVRSPGFGKKLLSEYKLDILGLCGFGCRYCSSNGGNYLRIRREPFADLTEEQLGERLYPASSPELTFEFPDVVAQLDAELATKPKGWGEGTTLVFSMLTDGFTPHMEASGVTRQVLELLLGKTAFRIRVLTKNAIVGSKDWVTFFLRHRDRFVVGLSIGTMDDRWAQAVEIGASLPSKRLRALTALQDAGVPTYGMLCPVFPDVLADGRLEELVDRIRPDVVEHVWAEPYNDRTNWRVVRDGYEPDSPGWDWFTRAFEREGKRNWSRYAVELGARLQCKARREGWLEKLRYLLYENDVLPEGVVALGSLEGILPQSSPGPDGFSKNVAIAEIQREHQKKAG